MLLQSKLNMFSPEHLTEGTSSPRGCKAWQTPELFNHILVLPHCAHELHLSKVLRSHALQTSAESSRPWMSKVCCRPTQALAAPRPKVQTKMLASAAQQPETTRRTRKIKTKERRPENWKWGGSKMPSRWHCTPRQDRCTELGICVQQSAFKIQSEVVEEVKCLERGSMHIRCWCAHAHCSIYF